MVELGFFGGGNKAHTYWLLMRDRPYIKILVRDPYNEEAYTNEAHWASLGTMVMMFRPNML